MTKRGHRTKLSPYGQVRPRPPPRSCLGVVAVNQRVAVSSATGGAAKAT